MFGNAAEEFIFRLFSRMNKRDINIDDGAVTKG